MATISELRQRNTSWANASDEAIAKRAAEKGIKIDLEPASVPNGNGSPNLAAAAKVLADRNAKPHVWSALADRWGVTVDTLKGYAKAIGTGVEKAAIGTAATVGDIASTVGPYTEYARSAVGNLVGVPSTPEETQARIAERSAAVQPFTSAAYTQAARDIGVPFHEPQNRAERVLQTGGELAGNLAAPGGFVRRVASVAVPTAAGEGLGYMFEGGPYENIARALGIVGGGVGAATLRSLPKRPTVPTTQELKSQAGQQYRAAEASGVTVPAQAYDTIAQRVIDTAMKSGADPDLTPKVATAMKRVTDAQGADKTVSEMDRIRRKIAIAAGSNDPSERRIASSMREEFDKGYETLAPPELAEARKTTRRYKGGEVLDEIQRQAPIKGAQYSQAGIENAYRERYRQLAMSPQKMRQFNPEQQQAITRVATGSAPENFLRGVGKYAPTGVIPFLGGVGGGSYVGNLFGSPELGGLAGAGIAAVGTAGKMAATAATRRNVRAAEAAVRADPQLQGAYKSARDRALAEMRARLALQAGTGGMAAIRGLLE
jgi:hypothetical protein